MKALKQKKALEMDLARIIAITVGLLVFIVILWQPIQNMTKRVGSQGECNWNLFISAAVRGGSLGFAELEPGCRAEYLTVDRQTLDPGTKSANKRIKKYHQNYESYGNAARTFSVSEGGQPTYDAKYEWSLDKLIAQKMTQCWDKVWHGKLDFFEENWVGQKIVCVTCSVMNFAGDLPGTLKDKPIISLYDWMQAEPYYKQTYYQYVTEGTTIKPTPGLMAYSTQEPLAIVYIQSKESWWSAAAEIVAYSAVAVGSVMLIATGVGAPAGIAGAIALGTTGAAAGIGAATVTHEVKKGQESKSIDPKEAAKSKDVKAIGVAPYGELRKFCTDIIA